MDYNSLLDHEFADIFSKEDGQTRGGWGDNRISPAGKLIGFKDHY